MWIWIAVGALLSLVGIALCIPIVVYVGVEEDMYAYYRYLFIKRWVYPKEKKPIPQEKKKGALTRRAKRRVTSADSWKYLTRHYGFTGAVRMMVDSATALVKNVWRLLEGAKIRKLKGEIRVTGQDAAEAATNYGQVCAVVYPFLGLIGNQMQFVRPDLKIHCDYEATEPLIRLSAKIYITLPHTVEILWHMFKEMVDKNIQILSKGGKIQ